jgi:hypothetical protein
MSWRYSGGSPALGRFSLDAARHRTSSDGLGFAHRRSLAANRRWPAATPVSVSELARRRRCAGEGQARSRRRLGHAGGQGTRPL